MEEMFGSGKGRELDRRLRLGKKTSTQESRKLGQGKRENLNTAYGPLGGVGRGRKSELLKSKKGKPKKKLAEGSPFPSFSRWGNINRGTQLPTSQKDK